MDQKYTKFQIGTRVLSKQTTFCYFLSELILKMGFLNANLIPKTMNQN